MLEKHRILVVEDETVAGMAMVAVLKRNGAEVLGPVGSLANAFKALGSTGRPFEAALLDINLVGEMVYPFADALIERGIPFAFVTVYRGRDLPPHLQQIPIYTKPLDFKSIAALVRFGVLKHKGWEG